MFGVIYYVLHDADHQRAVVPGEDVCHVLNHVDHVLAGELLSSCDFLFDHFSNSQESGCIDGCGSNIVFGMLWNYPVVGSNEESFLGVENEWQMLVLNDALPVMLGGGAV